MSKTKICKKCGEEKDITLFVKNKGCKDGYEGKCKECSHKINKQYKKEHQEEIKEYSKKYGKQYRKEHKEEMKE